MKIKGDLFVDKSARVGDDNAFILQSFFEIEGNKYPMIQFESNTVSPGEIGGIFADIIVIQQLSESGSVALNLSGPETSVSLEYIGSSDLLWIDSAVQIYDTDDLGRTIGLTLGGDDIMTNPELKIYGQITAAAAAKYAILKVDDTDDYIHLEKEDSNILGLKINAGITHIGDDTDFIAIKKQTIEVDTGESTIEVTFPYIEPNVNAIFGESSVGFKEKIVAIGFDTQTPSFTFLKYDQATQTVVSADLDFETDYATYAILKLSSDLQIGPDETEHIKIETIEITQGESTEYYKSIVSYDDAGNVVPLPITGGLVIVAPTAGNNSIIFISDEAEIQGFFGYSSTTDAFSLIGGSQGPTFGQLAGGPDKIISTFGVNGALEKNDTGDIGRIIFKGGRPGFIFPSSENIAEMDIVITFVGSSYPDDDDISAAIDFKTKHVTSGMVHVMRLSETQMVGIGNQDPQYKLDVTGQIRSELADTSVLTTQLTIDLSAIIEGLELTTPILECEALSTMPEVIPFSYALGVWDKFGIFDHSESGLAELLFASEDFSASASITCNLTDSRFEFNWPIFPSEDDTWDIGGSSNQWKDLYLSGQIIIGGTGPVADGTYTVGARLTPSGTDGSITVKGGIVTGITEAT